MPEAATLSPAAVGAAPARWLSAVLHVAVILGLWQWPPRPLPRPPAAVVAAIVVRMEAPPPPRPAAAVRAAAPAPPQSPRRQPRPRPAAVAAPARPAPVSAAPPAPAAAIAAPAAGPPAPAAAVPAGISEGVRVIDLPRPAYPQTARRLHLEGEVVVTVEVAADGRVGSVTVTRGSGYAVLDAAALAAIARARFAPARDRGRAVAATVAVPVRFRLVEGG